MYNDLEFNMHVNDESILKNMDCNSPEDFILVHCRIDLNTGGIN